MSPFVASVQHRLGVKFLEILLSRVGQGGIALPQKDLFGRTWNIACRSGLDLAAALPYGACKYDLLRYLVEEEDVLLYGSAKTDLVRLDPITPIPELLGKETCLFATDDPFLAMAHFFVKTPGRGRRARYLEAYSVRDRQDRLCFASLARELVPRAASAEGKIYILPKGPFTFHPRHHAQSYLSRQLYWATGGAVQSDFESREWISWRSVRPLAALGVTIYDLPCGVSWHERNESRLLAMLRFRRRQLPPPALRRAEARAA